MYYLYENGTKLCEIENFDFQPGVRPVRNITSLGGGVSQLFERPTPDRVSFTCSVLPNLSGNNRHEVRDDGGQSAVIFIETCNGSKTYAVTGIVP